ncbi:hypothetical protein F4825DRAFT_456199 [Nemania diffusa]|nr:hypothetical protein F4825DRAFT_456199 [Nemania diffusa]
MAMDVSVHPTYPTSLRWDDWLILASLSFVIVTDILVVYGANSINPTGAERAPKPSAVENSPAGLLYTKFSFIATVLYSAITSTAKLSILFLYDRLFSVSNTFRRQIIVLSIAINSLADPRYCINYIIFWFVTGVVEAFIDVLIILLPIEVVAKLQLTTKKKTAVCSVFVIDTFVIVSGLLKVIYGFVPGSRQPSFSRTSLWTTVHSGTNIIYACLPMCWPIFIGLGRSGEWAWVRSIKTSGHGLGGWSRLRPVNVPKESAMRYETPLDTIDRDMTISPNIKGVETSHREFEV